MAANIDIDSPLYFNSGEISFQQLKNTFGGGDAEGKNIKFSDYIRDTTDSKPAEDIIVPDSTENSDIPDTKENLSIETFRDSNKYYHVTFTGIAAQKEFESHFNNNLTKNIPKKLDIGEVDATEGGNTTGTLVSGDFEQYAATLTTPSISGGDEKQNIRNMRMNINPHSAIYGAAGAAGSPGIDVGGGGDGGGALHLNVGGANRYFVFSIKDDGKVYAGGGGGSQGSTSPARSISCSTRDNRYSKRDTFFKERRQPLPARSESVRVEIPGRRCRRSNKGRGTPVPAPGPGYRVAGHAEGAQMRDWRGRRGRGSVCVNSYTKIYDPERNTEPAYYREDPVESRTTVYKTATAPAGVGGAGGAGQGWIGGSTGSIQAAQTGSPGGRGFTKSCSGIPGFTFKDGSLSKSFARKGGTTKPYSGGSTSTNPGGQGGTGATWGKDIPSGGRGGTAILHNGFTNQTSKFVGTGNDAKLKGRFTS